MPVDDDTLVMILAGGEGKRLYPLTRDRAKPAVPFGGRYRIIDFVINNFLNCSVFPRFRSKYFFLIKDIRYLLITFSSSN